MRKIMEERKKQAKSRSRGNSELYSQLRTRLRNRYKIVVHSTRENVQDAFAKVPLKELFCSFKGVLANASCEDAFAIRVQGVSKKNRDVS
jgi:hypothetical protein